MKRLFLRTLLTLLAALIVLVGVMAVVLVSGFQRSLDEWHRAKTAQLEAVAREILEKYPNIPALTVPEDVPLFVFDARQQLIFSNRGEAAGRRRSSPIHGELIPISEDGVVLGYYRSGKLQFQNDAANNRFFESINRTIRLGLLLALLISIPFGLVFSRSLANPAVRLARGLDRIARGDLSVQIPEKGAEEIARIARSANRLSRQLEREQDIRRQWVEDIAHDLRTPIAAMKAQFEGMRDGVLDLSPGRIDKSLREISRVETLVADLEELMRLESPEMKPAPAQIDAGLFVEELQERFALELERRNLAFESRVAIERLQADPSLLHRAVANFFTNALRHTPEGGRIILFVEAAQGGKIRIALANTGDPLAQEELGKVFDRLYRGEYARSSPGSGLGLTISRRIAELHGGTVRIGNLEEGGVGAGVIVEMLLDQSAMR